MHIRNIEECNSNQENNAYIIFDYKKYIYNII